MWAGLTGSGKTVNMYCLVLARSVRHKRTIFGILKREYLGAEGRNWWWFDQEFRRVVSGFGAQEAGRKGGVRYTDIRRR